MQHKLSPAGKIIWKVAVVIQSIMGFTMGLYLFTYGPLFYETFAKCLSPNLAMTFTTLLFSINFGFIALFEVPTGAIGDAIGRKQTVIWSMVFRMLFFLLLALFSILGTLKLLFPIGILAVLSFALGYSLFSGSFTAWCVDSFRQAEPGVGYEHILSQGYFCSFMAQIIGGVLGVMCYLQGISHIGFLIAAWACIMGIVYCLQHMREDEVSGIGLKDLRFAPVIERMGKIVSVGFDVFKTSPAILSLVAIFASYMVVTNVVDYLWPVYLRNKVPTLLQGSYWILLVVITLMAAAFGSKIFRFWSQWRSHKTGINKASNTALRRWLCLSCLISAVPIIVLGYLTKHQVDSFWCFVSAILPVLIAYGIIAPCFETLVNNHIPDEHAKERATILSFASLIRSILVMVLAIPAGGTSGATTTIGWIIPATLLLIVTFVGGALLKRKQLVSCTTPVQMMPQMDSEIS